MGVGVVKNIIRCLSTAILTGLLLITVGFIDLTPTQFSKYIFLMGPEDIVKSEKSLINGELNSDINTLTNPDLGIDKNTSTPEDTSISETPPLSFSPSEAQASESEDQFSEKPSKVAYLTFDDGPSREVTLPILDIANHYQIKVTFFVIGKQAEKHPEIVQRAFIEGHTIGNHSYSHQYSEVYRTADTLINEINICTNILGEIIGDNPKIFRPPGGSIPFLKEHHIDRLIEKGYIYYDWNVCPGDAAGSPKTPEMLINNTIKQAQGKDRIIILLHDSSRMTSTVKALPSIIEGLKEMGFIFEVITPATEPIQFKRKHNIE
jgi:peptidoglycan/xylan/chitin deacetylase (PgdA/CDA1 family)